MYPVFLMFKPELAASLLEYRFQRIPEAMQKARGDGWKGSLFPWESGFTGCEVCPYQALTGKYVSTKRKKSDFVHLFHNFERNNTFPEILQ